MVQQNQLVTAADLNTLFVQANNVGSLAGDYGTRGKWLAEMNRLRKDVFNKLKVKPDGWPVNGWTLGNPLLQAVWPMIDAGGNLLSSNDDPKNPPAYFPFASVSGVWPLSIPNAYSGKQDFCFADTGNTEEVKMTRWLYATWGSFGDDEYRNNYVVNKNFINLDGAPSSFITLPQTDGRFAVGLMKSKRKFAIVISGSDKIKCHGVIIIPIVYLERGYTQTAGSQPIYDNTSIFDLLDVTSTLPVQVEKIKNYRPLDDDEPNPYPHFTNQRVDALVWRFNGDIEPGRYEITLTVPDAGDNKSDFHYTLQSDGSGGWFETENYTDVEVKSRVDISAQLIWNGRFEQPSSEAFTVNGIHDKKEVKCISITPIFPALCSVSGSPEVVFMYQAPITASTDGYWFGRTYPIGNFFVPAGNPVSPIRWQANVFVPCGCQVYDKNGNIWTCIQAGNTAPREPFSYCEHDGNLSPWLFYTFPWPIEQDDIYEETDYAGGLPVVNPAKWMLTNLVRTRYETPWFQAIEAEFMSHTFNRSVGEMCASSAGDLYQCTKTQKKVHGFWVDSESAVDGLYSSHINVFNSEPNWNRAIGSVTRLENGTDAVEWTSIFHAGETVKAGQSRVKNRLVSYPCIWNQDVWLPEAQFNLGRKIFDGGRIWVCSNSGQTGAMKPDFSGDAEVGDGSAKWQLESKVNYYGCEGIRYYKNSQCWIRQLFLNRVVHESPIWSAGSMAGSVGNSFPDASRQSIPVEIGFYRNGNFVSLGHYMTGQQPIVLWPIFTETPLVYKADERVDVQASVIRPDFGFTYQHELKLPISAEHYNDLEKSLSLI